MVQHAIITAKNRESRYPNIFSSVAGVIFLGTPHHGTGSLTASGLYGMVFAQQKKVEPSILRLLEADNDGLREMVDTFLTFCTEDRRLEIRCFYEQKSSNVGKVIGHDKELIVG